MIEWIFLMSLTGSVLFGAWWVLCRLTGNLVSARWQYAALKLSLLFLLVPVGPCLKALLAAKDRSFVSSLATHSAQVLPVLPAAEPHLAAAAPAQLSISPAASQILGLMWVLGAAAMLVYKGAAFSWFRRRLKNARQIPLPPYTQILLLTCQQQLGVLGTIQVRISPAAPTPFVMGLFRPVIVLPDQPFSYQELRYILLHELTHLKRGDLWIRWASMLAAAVHWWNPVVYLLDRKVIELSEESCDERIVVRLSHQERCRYGQVLLKVICSTAMPEDLTAPLSTAKLIQRRLSKMLRVKSQSRKQKIFSLCMVLVLLVCGTVTALAARSPITVQEKTALINEAQPDPKNTLSSDLTPDVPESGAAAEDLTVTQPEEEIGHEYRQPISDHAAADTSGVQNPGDEAPVSGQSMNASLEKKVIAVVSEGDQLLYTQYADGSQVNSPYYQQQLDQILDEANAQGILINGQYPRNSSGETYGPDGGGIYGLSAAVGEAPSLTAAVGTNGEHGYIRRSDERFVPHDLPADQCPHTFTIPLYDSEGTVIGEFSLSCGGHVSTAGKSIDEVNAEIAGEAAATGSDLE